MRSRQSKRRKRKFSWYLVWTFIFAIFIGSAAAFFLTLPIFNIREVKTEGCRLMPDELILKEARLPIGENIFLTRFGGAEKRILSHPPIKKVDFIRSLPDVVIIKVTERKEAGVTVLSGQSVLVDDEGYVFIPELFPDITRLPVLNGTRTEWIKDNRIVGEVGEGMIKLLKEFKSFISPTRLQVDVSNIEEINLLVDDTLRVKIGDSEQLDRKIRVFESIFARNKEKKNDIEYIDVRFPAFPVVKFK